nr:MAG TPA: STRUCTURAL MAINTENANCE OF CHROMOSOMES PROTEIN [Caudoviricetes sp.]
MWRPVRVKFSNLFAHQDTEYFFKNKVCTVIFGENRDAEDCDNNGAGKSTIFEAIAIALTNKSLRDLDKEMFINRDAEDCTIEFELQNDVLNSSLKIVRKFFRGSKSAKIELIENGKVNSQMTSVNEANKRIYELIGISREDLLRYYIISQDNSYTFFKAGDVEKKEVLNRITSADMINPIIEELGDRKKQLTSDISEIESSISSIQDKIEFFKEQKANNEAVSDDYEIKAKSDRIEEIKEKRRDYERKVKKIDADIDNVQKNIEEVKSQLVPTDDLKSKRKKLKKSIDDYEKELSDSKSILRKINAEIDGVVECPNCKHKFIQGGDLDLSYSEAVDMKKDTEILIKDYEEKIKSKKSKLDGINLKIQSSESLEEKIEDFNFSINSYKRKKKSYQEEIDDASKSINAIAEEIRRIKAESKTEKVRKELEAKLKSLSSELKELENSSSEKQELLEIVNYWIYYMGKNGFATYLANRAVSIIEGITNSHLRKLHSNLSVEINGYKVLKDGTVREKIDVRVLDGGISSTVFMGCSGGERGRVSLAGVLGIQHLINLSLDGRGLDLLLLDETFHGVDSRGQENMIKILENIGNTILMITQNVSSEFNSENKILIVKEDGVAKIVK